MSARLAEQEYQRSRRQKRREYNRMRGIDDPCKRVRGTAYVTDTDASRRKRLRYRELKIAMFSRLGGKCVNCMQEDWRVIHFDHMCGTVKVGTIGLFITRTAQCSAAMLPERMAALLAEVDKTRPLCANCHTLYTYHSACPPVQ